MATLLLAEHNESGLDGQTAQALTAALALGAAVDVLVAGEDCRAAAEAAARLGGAGRVLLADHPVLAHQLAEPMAALLVELMADYVALLAPATARGRDILPRAAGLLDVAQVSDVIAVVDASTFRRPTYAGNAVETVATPAGKQVLTVRASAFAPAPEGGTAEIVPIAAPTGTFPTRFASAQLSVGARPDLSAARVVVSGGRALGSREKFDALLTPLADKLGAALGASRVAVDSGYAPNEIQVGQTGRVVVPELYIACGISGAAQHLAGMKDAKVIVAINSDPQAPIFAVADYGLVGDIFELVPRLTALL
jgi:electron transfer flavoprotein alpha subunit